MLCMWRQGPRWQGLHDGDGDSADGADGDGDGASHDESCSDDFLLRSDDLLLPQYIHDADYATDDGTVVGRRDSCGAHEGAGRRR